MAKGDPDSEWERNYQVLTVGELRKQISDLPEDVEIHFGATRDANELVFYRFKWRDKKVLQIELNERHPDELYVRRK